MRNQGVNYKIYSSKKEGKKLCLLSQFNFLKQAKFKSFSKYFLMTIYNKTEKRIVLINVTKKLKAIYCYYNELNGLNYYFST